MLHLLEMRLSDGPELWGKIMFGMAAGEKTAFADELGIPRDYDDWWFYRQHWRTDLPTRTRLQYLDFHTFMPELVLTKVDRTSMAVSLEARVPLLARRIVEYVFSLPESVRFPGGALKGLLRHAYRGVLPASVLDRRKKGFGIPRHYLRDVAAGSPIQSHILTSMYL
jgi:asparagine synthase (glutamine-hydrolysing)